MEETAEKKFEKIKNFINNCQIITQLSNGNYIVYSPFFKMITSMNISKARYIEYWVNTVSWLNNEEYKETIKQICENKLNNGTISRDEMMELIKLSVDREKDEALKLLRKKKKPQNERLANLINNL